MAYRKEYQGASYERYAAHNEQSTVHKLKETYWTTKQAVIKKLGKKEDEHVVASDQALDAKLEVFRAIQKSSMELLRVIENYQDRLCALSQEENSSGRFLKAHSQQDKTRAGKMMAAVGKSLSFSSQQRLSLRVPLVRLYQEVETFRYRAISDTLMTINRMESSRTEYRGALLWMKDQSTNLDPDTYKQLEKFRKIQAQVKKTKARFDRLKLDTMQKIDLLAASRCNMFSHVLANYQSTLLHFWSKTSRTMSAVADSFKGYQYYEFNMLKELCEPSKKLAEETSSNRRQAERDTDATESDGKRPYEDEETTESEAEDIDKPVAAEQESNKKAQPTPPTLKKLSQKTSNQATQEEAKKSSAQTGDLLGLDNDKSVENAKPQSQNNELLGLAGKSTDNSDFLGLMSNTENVAEKGQGENKQASGVSKMSPYDHIEELDKLRQGTGETERLINWDDETKEARRNSGSMNNLIEAIDREISDPAAGDRQLDFGDDEQSYEEMKKKQDEELDFTGKILERKEREKKERQKHSKNTGAADYLSGEVELEEEEKDDMALLNAIFDAPSTGEDDFTKEWQAVFGATPLAGAGSQYTPVESDQPQNSADFLPSNLLASRLGGATGGQQSPANPQQQQQPAAAAGAQKAKPKKGQKQDMSAWFNLFADLDPLSNPDAIGKSEGEMDGAL